MNNVYSIATQLFDFGKDKAGTSNTGGRGGGGSRDKTGAAEQE